MKCSVVHGNFLFQNINGKGFAFPSVVSPHHRKSWICHYFCHLNIQVCYPNLAKAECRFRWARSISIQASFLSLSTSLFYWKRDLCFRKSICHHGSKKLISLQDFYPWNFKPLYFISRLINPAPPSHFSGLLPQPDQINKPIPDECTKLQPH